MRKVVVTVAALLAVTCGVAGGLSGCAADNGVTSANILTDQLPSDVSAQRVLLAAVILSSGDINAAVQKGLVTEADVTQARDAILSNTLDLWRQRAETDVKASAP